VMDADAALQLAQDGGGVLHQLLACRCRQRGKCGVPVVKCLGLQQADKEEQPLQRQPESGLHTAGGGGKDGAARASEVATHSEALADMSKADGQVNQDAAERCGDG
jgi:hypothetical protein